MEFSLNPDRERMNLTLVMGLLVNGRTVLDDFSWPSGAEKFAAALTEFGLTYELHGHQLVMGGCGFQYRFPSLLPIDFPEHESVLLWTLASKDSEQVYTFAAGDDEAGAAAVSAAKATLQKYFKVVAESDEPAKFVFRFAPEEPALKKDSLGNVPFVMRNRVLLRTLVRGEYVSFEERSLVHDQWTKMLMYFGVPLRYEGRGMEQLSEFERRLMMAQGKKIERTQMTELSEARVITGRDYYVPGDATEAMAFALLTTIGKVPKGNVVKLLNVDLNSTRAGALTCLKRMGANIETVTRREKFGDVYGDVEIYPMEAGKRLQGRRFGEDAIATSLSEYAFLAVAACYAEGETILRIPKEVRAEMRVANDFLAENLRKTGVEVGVYDDGLVVRGMETIVNGSDFDGGSSPEAGLALTVLSLSLENDEPVANADDVEAKFPGIIEKLKQVLVAEAPAGDAKE
jgi:5-enolpyruvylshikimate-3-phosphate synthase